MGILLWPVASVVAAARLLFAWLSNRQTQSRIRLLLGAAAVAFLFASLVVQIRLLAIQDSMSEDSFSGIFLLFWTDATALMACVAMAWTLRGKRMGAAIGLVVIFACAVIPAAAVPFEAAGQVTEQRAGQIDQAILRFHDATGRYPASLEELSPR